MCSRACVLRASVRRVRVPTRSRGKRHCPHGDQVRESNAPSTPAFSGVPFHCGIWRSRSWPNQLGGQELATVREHMDAGTGRTRRLTTETKHSSKTTELYAMVLAV